MKSLLLSLLVICLTASAYSQGRVEYRVESNPAGFDVTYLNGEGNIEQVTVPKAVWSIGFDVKSGEFLSVSAQAKGEGATISVEILYEGQVIKRATSNGDYVIASADAAAGKFPDVYPYNKTFSGEQAVIPYAPLLAGPDMTEFERIGPVKTETVLVLEKVNAGYYKVKSGEVTGYLWAGWFSR